MGLLDVMFGRKRLKGAAQDRLFALATAQVTLDVELGLRPGGAAAVCFKPLSGGDFARVDGEVQELLAVVAQASGTTLRRHLRQQVGEVVANMEGQGIIYGFKTGSFWPFVPTGEERRRDNAEELSLRTRLERELPMEPDLSKWLALYDAPL